MGFCPGELPADVAEVLERRKAPPDGARVAMDPGGERIVAGPAAGIGPGEVEQGREHPQVGRAEPGVGGDVVGEGGEGDTGLGLGPPGALSPVRSAGPRPASGTRMWGSSRLAPPVPRRDPGLERRGRRRRGHGPQLGEAAGRLVGRERAEASRRGSVGRIFGDGFRPALALVGGSARIAHKNPLPGEPGVDFASAGSLGPVRPWHQRESHEPPEMVGTRLWGFRPFIQRRVLTLNP